MQYDSDKASTCVGKDEGKNLISKLADNSVSQANTYPLHSALVKAKHLEQRTPL